MNFSLAVYTPHAEHEKESELYGKKITVSHTELKESYRRSVEMIVYFFRYLGEYELAAVRERKFGGSTND
jgi:hypothetical protein